MEPYIHTRLLMKAADFWCRTEIANAPQHPMFLFGSLTSNQKTGLMLAVTGKNTSKVAGNDQLALVAAMTGISVLNHDFLNVHRPYTLST